MDDGAFVDSLLAPDMRAASASVAVALGMQPLQPLHPFAQELAGVGERKRPGGRRRTAAASGMAYQQQFGQMPPPDDAIGRGGTSTADLDDSLFRQLMGSASGGAFGPDADEMGSLPPLSTSSLQMTLAALASSSAALSSKDSAVENPPTSTNSLMFEPLELPRGGITAPLDQSFKDAFGAPVVQDGADSPVVSPPNSACSLRSLASVFQGDPCSTPRSPVYSDPSSMMPVQPLSSHGHAAYFASSSMAASNGFASNAPSFSMSAASPVFWMNTSHSASNSLMRGMMDGFDSSSPPESMRQMLLMSSGIVSPPGSTGSGVGLPFSNASLLTLQHLQQQQQQQFAMWTQSSAKTQARPTRTPTATASANQGKKRARARQTNTLSEPLSIQVPSLSPTSESDKQLVVSADMHGKNSDARAEGSSSSSRTAKRPRTSRVRSPSTVSPVAMLTPTTSPSGSASDGDMSSTARSTKGKKCVEPGCTRRAQSNSRCKAHGGGARCQFAGPGGCSRSSQGGGFCRAHGGGKRCEFPGCVRGQQRKGRCYVHGGIRRCQWAGCEKKDRGNGFCISHGGGKRCEREGCARAVRRGKLCQLHDGSRQDE